jgi:hypothetical protein
VEASDGVGLVFLHAVRRSVGCLVVECMDSCSSIHDPEKPCIGAAEAREPAGRVEVLRLLRRR